MADLSKITLPSGTTYDLKDAQARTDIAAIQSGLTGAMKYIGTTTTALTDGATTAQIVIGTTTYYCGTIPASTDRKELTSGNVVIYQSKEYVVVVTGTGTSATCVWNEFGSTGSLKALAFKDNATGSTNFTPRGTINKPGVSVNAQSTNVNSIADVGTLPSCTLPSLTCTVSNEILTLSWSAGSFNAGTLPTKGGAVAVLTSATAELASNPTFTGTQDTISITAS